MSTRWAVYASARRPRAWLGLSAYPYLASVLQQLAAREVRLGIICRTPAVSAESLSAALAAAGINAFFDQDLLIFAADGVEREPRSLFYLAAGKAGLLSSPGSCLLVSEDSIARGQALAAGWRVTPHPLLTQAVLEGDALWFVRITVPPHRAAEEWRAALRGLALVPLRVSGEGGRTVLAIASGTALAELANAQFDVQPLGQEGDPASSDLYVIRDDAAAGSGFLSGSGQFAQLFGQGNGANQGLLLSASDEGILIRVPSARSIEEFHFATAAHGHNLKLVPDPGLLGSEADGRGQRLESRRWRRNATSRPPRWRESASSRTLVSRPSSTATLGMRRSAMRPGPPWIADTSSMPATSASPANLRPISRPSAAPR